MYRHVCKLTFCANLGDIHSQASQILEHSIDAVNLEVELD
jgi:hypothetical protein